MASLGLRFNDGEFEQRATSYTDSENSREPSLTERILEAGRMKNSLYIISSLLFACILFIYATLLIIKIVIMQDRLEQKPIPNTVVNAPMIFAR